MNQGKIGTEDKQSQRGWRPCSETLLLDL